MQIQSTIYRISVKYPDDIDMYVIVMYMYDGMYQYMKM